MHKGDMLFKEWFIMLLPRFQMRQLQTKGNLTNQFLQTKGNPANSETNIHHWKVLTKNM